MRLNVVGFNICIRNAFYLKKVLDVLCNSFKLSKQNWSDTARKELCPHSFHTITLATYIRSPQEFHTNVIFISPFFRIII